MENPYIQLIETTNLRIESLKELEKVWTLFHEIEPLPNLNWEYNYIIIDIKNIDDLHETSQIIKQIYPDWKYTLDRIDVPWGKDVEVMWYDKEIPFIRIVLRTTVDNFPKSLKKDGCGFKTIRQDSSESISYVCEVNHVS